LEEGIEMGMVGAFISQVLSWKFGQIPKSIKLGLKETANLKKLLKLLEFSFDCQSIEEFEKKVMKNLKRNSNEL